MKTMVNAVAFVIGMPFRIVGRMLVGISMIAKGLGTMLYRLGISTVVE